MNMAHLDRYLKTMQSRMKLEKGEYYYVQDPHWNKGKPFIARYEGAGMLGSHAFCEEDSEKRGRSGCVIQNNMEIGADTLIRQIPKNEIIRYKVKEDPKYAKVHINPEVAKVMDKLEPGWRKHPITNYRFKTKKPMKFQ